MMGGKIDAVLKRDDIESSGVACENLLLPEVRATHGIFGGEKQAIKKNSKHAIEPDCSAEVEPTQAEQASDNTTHRPNVEAELGVNNLAAEEAIEQSNDGDDPPLLSEADLARIEAEFADEMPSTLENYDERMTLSRLKQTASDVRRKAIQEGFRIGVEQGHAQALAMGEADTKNQKDSLVSITLALGQALNAEQEQLSSLLSQTVTAIATVYCSGRLQVNAEFIQAMVDKALGEFAESDSRPVVTLCPADLALLEESNLLSANCDWLEDASLSQGGCLVNGKYSAVNFSLEEQIQQISADLLAGARE